MLTIVFREVIFSTRSIVVTAVSDLAGSRDNAICTISITNEHAVGRRLRMKVVSRASADYAESIARDSSHDVDSVDLPEASMSECDRL